MMDERHKRARRHRLQVIADGAAGSQAILDQQPEGNLAALRCIG